MILACQKLLGQITKVLGMRGTLPPRMGKTPKKTRIFFSDRLPMASQLGKYFFQNKILWPIPCKKWEKQGGRQVKRSLNEQMCESSHEQRVGAVSEEEAKGFPGSGEVHSGKCLKGES